MYRSQCEVSNRAKYRDVAYSQRQGYLVCPIMVKSCIAGDQYVMYSQKQWRLISLDLTVDSGTGWCHSAIHVSLCICIGLVALLDTIQLSFSIFTISTGCGPGAHHDECYKYRIYIIRFRASITLTYLEPYLFISYKTIAIYHSPLYNSKPPLLSTCQTKHLGQVIIMCPSRPRMTTQSESEWFAESSLSRNWF
jgi:hypothetical protein